MFGLFGSDMANDLINGSALLVVTAVVSESNSGGGKQRGLVKGYEESSASFIMTEICFANSHQLCLSHSSSLGIHG